MLAEVLVFSLLVGVATLAHVYRVFSDSTVSGQFKLKLIETTLFGTAPGTVGIVLGIEPASAEPSAHVVFLVFSGLFSFCLVLRYVFSGALLRRLELLLDVGTSLSLVGVAVSIAVAEGAGATAPFCLTYIALFYFWAVDEGDDGAAVIDAPSVYYSPVFSVEPAAPGSADLAGLAREVQLLVPGSAVA